jgi:hypothetical protein
LEILLKSLTRSIAALSFSLLFLLAAFARPALAQSDDDASPDSKTAESKLSVSPKSLSFDVNLDSKVTSKLTETKHFTIKNTGKVTLDDLIVGTPTNSDYLITTTVPSTIDPKGSLKVEVEFTPKGSGTDDGTIAITSGATSGKTSATVELKGKATQKKPTPTATATATPTATQTPTDFVAIPLIDEPTAVYTPAGGTQSFELGLYHGTNNIAAASVTPTEAALRAAAAVVPLCRNGRPPSPTCTKGGIGVIGLVAIGFSNSQQQTCSGTVHISGQMAPTSPQSCTGPGTPWECCTGAGTGPTCSSGEGCVSGTFGADMYAGQTSSPPTVNPAVYLVDCDEPGVGTNGFNSAFTDIVWTLCENQVAKSHLTDAQIQAAVMEIVETDPSGNGFSTLSSMTHAPPCASGDTSTIDACYVEQQAGAVIRLAKEKFPNLRLLYLYTRAYGGWAITPLSPEPNAYEYGFSAQFLVQAQINQADNGGSADGVAGNLAYSVAPVVLFAPYQWASGATANSEGTVWPDLDTYFYTGDWTHYGTLGYTQSGSVMNNYFLGTSASGARDADFTTWFQPP